MKHVFYSIGEKHQYLETSERESMELSLIQLGKESCDPNHTVTTVHNDYVIHFILSGRGFYSCNGRTYPLKEGQMFLIRPGDTIVYGADKFLPWTYAWIGFKGVRSDSMLKKCGFSKSRLVRTAPPQEEILDFFEEFFEHTEETVSGNIYRESMLYRLFYIMAGDHEKRRAAGENDAEKEYSENPHIRTAQEFIIENYMKDISVIDIAEHVGVSRAHLNHVFNQNFGITIQNYLMDFRMGKAENLLVTTTISVKAIADLVGYRDALVFSKAFKRKFGLSPKDYRLKEKR